MPLPKTKAMKSAQGDIYVPCVGFGTWASTNASWCQDATLNALKAGYRHIDCAWSYGVDEEVGAAIRESKIPRSEIFVTSKFWPQFAAPENVEKCLDLCLKNMGLDYIDLFLAHWPVAFQARSNIATAKAFHNATNEEKGIVTNDSDEKPVIDWTHTAESIAAVQGEKGSFKPTWKAMQELVKKSKIRAAGVSNFTVAQLQEVLSVGGEVPLSCNQVEAHPYFPNSELLDFMQHEEILATAYCPFAGPKSALLQDPIVKSLAEKNNIGVGQLLQSWAVQRGTIPLGKSQHEGQKFQAKSAQARLTKGTERIKANLDVQELSHEDFAALNQMDKGSEGRTVDLGPRWGVQFF